MNLDRILHPGQILQHLGDDGFVGTHRVVRIQWHDDGFVCPRSRISSIDWRIDGLPYLIPRDTGPSQSAPLPRACGK